MFRFAGTFLSSLFVPASAGMEDKMEILEHMKAQRTALEIIDLRMGIVNKELSCSPFTAEEVGGNRK